MKLLLLLSALVALLTGVRVLCQDPEPKEDADYWTSTNHQDGWLSSEPLREMLLRMTRKPRPHQFIGLMGRRSTGEGCSVCVCVCVCVDEPLTLFVSVCPHLHPTLTPLQQTHRSPGKDIK
uniref:Tachykinin precursor 1 n=1 Tax=Oryzias latipes TaxID=8090 RepID=A0A3P9HL65_ORYLA